MAKSVVYSYMIMNNEMNIEEEALFASHIARLEVLVAGRDDNNPWHQELNKVDRLNIASLREGRVPEYGDHLPGNHSGHMSEFDDIVEEQRLAIS